jgi:hypothetical protein
MISQNSAYLERLLLRRKSAVQERRIINDYPKDKKEPVKGKSSSNSDKVIQIEPNITVPRGNFYYPLNDNYKVK